MIAPLTTSFTQNGSGIGYPSITDTAVKASIQSVDLDYKSITMQIRAGTYAGSVFTPDPHLGIVGTLFINYGANPMICQVTNATGLNNEFNITIPAQITQINNIVANFTAAQAVIELFLCVSGGLFPGTQVTG